MSTPLQQVLQFAVDHEVPWGRCVDDNWGIHRFDPPPWNRLWGPVHDRGGVSGVVWQAGVQKAAWGEPERADLTFSVAKTYLALLAGVAHDRGLIDDVNEPISHRVPGVGFDDKHNAGVTWAQMLQQTSEWQGDCFGIPDQVDRYRAVSFAAAPNGAKGDARPLHAPGTYWEYNDVRINQLSLALLHLFRTPLPDVFREAIARPLGCSEQWQWVGYDHARVSIDGVAMISVPGGSHWGGGVSISASDQARIGCLLLAEGCVDGRRLLSADWIRRMRTPCPIAPFYGYLVWLNTERQMFPRLPASSYFAIGAGGSFTWVAPEQALVVVVRWLDSAHAETFFARLLDAL